jgi:hypothetical protein
MKQVVVKARLMTELDMVVIKLERRGEGRRREEKEESEDGQE